MIGGRGIGKSAIFQILARRERDAGSFVIELTPEDYSYELLTQTMASQSSGSRAKHGAYAAAWKYLIYVSIMKETAARRVRLPKPHLPYLRAYCLPYALGLTVEDFQYVEDSHVLRVFFFHVLKRLHDAFLKCPIYPAGGCGRRD